MNVIITTINPPNAATTSINDALAKTNGTLWVVGDVPGPYAYDLSNVSFLPIQQQREMNFSLAETLPERHYCRKNIGYLAAIERASPDFLLETDDDNFPYEAFFGSRQAEVQCDYIEGQGWSNVYALVYSDIFGRRVTQYRAGCLVGAEMGCGRSGRCYDGVQFLYHGVAVCLQSEILSCKYRLSTDRMGVAGLRRNAGCGALSSRHILDSAGH
jgi:hypothetical protein